MVTEVDKALLDFFRVLRSSDITKHYLTSSGFFDLQISQTSLDSIHQILSIATQLPSKIRFKKLTKLKTIYLSLLEGTLMQIFQKENPESFAFSNQRILDLFTPKVCIFLKI